jgi:hypothetical protein
MLRCCHHAAAALQCDNICRLFFRRFDLYHFWLFSLFLYLFNPFHVFTDRKLKVFFDERCDDARTIFFCFNDFTELILSL